MKIKFIIMLMLTLMSFSLLLSGCSNMSEPTQNDNIEFTLESDNTYSVSKVDTAVEGGIVIPEQYNGVPVTKINSFAFAECKSIKEVYVPNSIVEIGLSAFSGCSSLEKITLPFIGTQSLYIDNNDFPFKSNHLGVIFDMSEHEGSIKTKPINSPWSYYLPKSLKTVIVTGDILYGYAFSDCSYIESISLTGNVKELCSGLFQDCIRLYDINLPATIENVGSEVFTNTGFYNDNRNWEDNLLYKNNILIAAEKFISGDLVVSEDTCIIAGSAFEDCAYLKSVSIPEGIVRINGSTFSGCSSLSSIRIPKSVGYIGTSAFYKCDNLKEVYICNIEKWLSIEGYGSPLEYANKLYLNNEEIKSIEIPSTISKINKYALSFNSLEQVFIPSSVVSIESYAFYGATNLKQVYLSEGLESIGKNAFENCSNLSNIIIPKTVNSIGWNVFKNTPLYKNANFQIGNWLIKGNDSRGTYTVPSGVTHIADGAFYNCDEISHVIIPDSVTHIGNEVFSNCEGLRSISVSKNLQVIGEQAFFSSGLYEISLPTGLREIQSSAFSNCKYLTEIIIPNTVVYIGKDAFKWSDGLSIYCQAESQPPAWDENWNISNNTVAWGYN